MTFKKILIFLILFSSCSNYTKTVTQQERIDLVNTINDIWALDQKYRLEATNLRIRNNGKRTKDESELWRKQSLVDSINMVKIEDIIQKFGYPGKKLVGDKLKSVGAFVILHNPKKQEKYLKMLRKESKKGNIDKREVAMLEDRIHMFKGEKQIYGSMMKYDTVAINPQTMEVQTKLIIWDIRDFKNLDKKREKVGLYSLKLQCELENIDWSAFKSYKPQKNKFDFDIQNVQK